MYSLQFVSDSGETYVFGKNGNNVFDADFGDGASVNLGTSQGFSQVGETVQSQTVSGRDITISGVVFGNVYERKETMRKIISPFSSGKIVFEGKYFARVYVKNAPSFSPVKNDGRFTLRLFAPFPFFYSVNTQISEIGSVKPLFSFPVNYAFPHKFGEKAASKYRNIVNNGDVSVPFSVLLQTSAVSRDIVIANLLNFKTLKINGKISVGETINIYRDNYNVLRAELISGNVTTDIISWIDETSDLFELGVGANFISATDSYGGNSLSAKIVFNPAVVALYES